MGDPIKFNFITNIEDCTDDVTFAILQSYFNDIKPVDKYIRATISTIFSRVCKEIYKDKMPDKVSQKKVLKIQKKIIEKLRLRYGKWLNFNLEWTRRTGFRFKTNLDSTYVTAKGKLYGHWEGSVLRALFYTSHALERFDERVDPSRYNDFYKTYKRTYGVAPTAADLLDQLIMFTSEYAIDKDIHYLNVHFGVLVIESFRGVHIVKTFLTSDMMSDKDLNWYELAPTEFEKKESGGKILLSDFNSLFDHKCISCEPDFLDSDDCLPTDASIALAKGLRRL